MPHEYLGRYEILEALRHGAAGPVLLAHDPQLGRRVVIQSLRFLSALPADQQAEMRERLLREVGRARTFSDPGIVALLDTDESEGVPFLVTEHVEGVHLDAYCERSRRLETEIAVELIAGAADALGRAHDRSIVHGAIRPSNLIRVGERGIKVDDFGLALARRIGTLEPSGLPAYVSPEVLRKETPDGRSDLFSLAAVLYELLTGQRAFPGDSVTSILFRIVNEDPVEPDPGDVSPELWAVVRRGLSKRPDERFPSCADFAHALRAADLGDAASRSEAMDGRAPAPSSRAVPTVGAPARSSVRPFVLGAMLVLLVAIVGLFLWRGLPGIDRTPPVVWWETRVVTQPEGLEVLLDGLALDGAAEGLVRFRSEGPFGVLSVSQACRTIEHQLGPADAGTDVVLVVDPVELDIEVDPAVKGASVVLNGKNAGVTPTSLHLDLCRENKVEVTADGFRGFATEIPAGAAPLDARKSLYGLSLEAIPRGKLVIPRKKNLQLVVYVDGKRLKASQLELELEEGGHEIRFKNEYHWIDVRKTVTVEGGGTVTPSLEIPLATLKVQAYPANCKVYLRKPGGRWKYMDETPAERRVATGRYEIKVELNPTGETRVEDVTLVKGDNPAVRVSFGSGR